MPDKHEDLNLIPRSYINRQVWCYTPEDPAVGRRREENPWGSLASQPNQQTLGPSERLFYKNKMALICNFRGG